MGLLKKQRDLIKSLVRPPIWWDRETENSEERFRVLLSDLKEGVNGIIHSQVLTLVKGQAG